VIHIEGSPIEAKMYKALAGKVGEHAMLVQLFDSEIKGEGLQSKKPGV
jgi:hypothetical protein